MSRWLVARIKMIPDAAARLVLDSTDTGDGDELTFQVTGGHQLPQ